MTERLCLVLGLHVETTGLSRADQAVRRRIWWAMAFQNIHFSLAYDRPSITMVSQPEIPSDPNSIPGHHTYFETLCRIVSLSLELLRSCVKPEKSHLRFHEIREFKQRIQRTLAEATPHLRHREHCQTLGEHIERTELRLHSSYLLSLVCRTSLDPHALLDEQRRAIIRQECVSSLLDTVDAFVELHEVNSHCSRSWISLQCSIASAFLLVTNDESTTTWELVGRLERVLVDHVYANGEVNQNNHTDSTKHLASSLCALREIRQVFRVRKSVPAAPSQDQTFSWPVMLSAPSIDTSPEMPSSLVAFEPGRPPENSNMRLILGRVSDIMLFPSMSEGNPIVCGRSSLVSIADGVGRAWVWYRGIVHLVIGSVVTV